MVDRTRDILSEIRFFSAANLADRICQIAFYYKVRDDLATVNLAKGLKDRDDAKIKSALQTKYIPTDPLLIQYAESVYQRKLISTDAPTRTNALLTPDQQAYLDSLQIHAPGIKTAFEWLLNEYQISEYQVMIDDETTAIDVRDKSDHPMTVFIPTTRLVTGTKLLELMYHEIEGHVRQSLNGKSFVLGGGPLKIDDETLYEGLARRQDIDFHQRFFGSSGDMPDPYYTFAANLAEQGASFYDIFQSQMQRTNNPNLSWTTTYRIMRGHINTANPDSYAFTKDLAYLRGYLMDSQLRQLGLGHYNEIAVIQTNALALLGRIDIQSSDLPHPFKDLTKKYCFEVLLS